MNRSLLIVAALAAAPAFAQWPTDKPKTETKPADTATPPPPPPPRRAARSGPAEDDGSGFSLGLRGAWAWPYGGLTDTEDVAESVDHLWPVRFDAGYWINRNIYLGAYAQYAFGFTNCSTGGDCSAHDWNFGIEAIYNLMPGQFVQPWVGVGFGYEILSRSRSGDDTSYKGLELGNIELGIDFALSKNFTIGPFGALPVYSKFSSFTANGQSNDISNGVIHRWLQVGLKATFHL